MEKVNKILKHEVYNCYLKRNIELEKERIFCRHNLQHFLDVARIAYIEALENNYKIEKEIIYAAALLHDIGRWKQYTEGVDHAVASGEMAESILLDCGFDDEDIVLIIEAIKKHRKGKNLTSQLDIAIYKGDKASRLCIECNSINQCKRFLEDKEVTLEY
ncbi:MAG: HD domain-containing protein [Clostridiaceae bacterium]|nr:HD domain-containing protein [Clostridiaceae bacterium]